MFRVTLAVLAILSLAGLNPADAAAASKRKKPKVRAAPVGTLQGPAVARPTRPSWASPYDCYTDDGYGRYLPCGIGKE